jgi:hypothetical protein
MTTRGVSFFESPIRCDVHSTRTSQVHAASSSSGINVTIARIPSNGRGKKRKADEQVEAGAVNRKKDPKYVA